MEVGGFEPPTRYVAQGLTGHCDQNVTVFWQSAFMCSKFHPFLASLNLSGWEVTADLVRNSQDSCCVFPNGT